MFIGLFGFSCFGGTAPMSSTLVGSTKPLLFTLPKDIPPGSWPMELPMLLGILLFSVPGIGVATGVFVALFEMLLAGATVSGALVVGVTLATSGVTVVICCALTTCAWPIDSELVFVGCSFKLLFKFCPMLLKFCSFIISAPYY